MRYLMAVGMLAIELLAVSWGWGAEKVVVKGSNTFGEELAPRLIKVFSVANPGIEVELESKGSASGFAALLAGECDIAASSRIANEDEKRMAKSRDIRLASYTVGYYGVAVIVNARNPVTNLMDRHVRDLFTGAVHNWKAVGGKDRPVQLYIRDPISGTYLGFQELAMENKPYAPGVRMFRSYAEIADAVSKDPDGVGYVGMTLSGDKAIRAATINGLAPDTFNVNEGLYPYARQVRLYTDRNRESKAARRFIRFVQSGSGQDVVKQLGFVRRFEPRRIEDWTSP